MLAAAVEWTPLIELLAVIIGTLAVITTTALGAVWAVARSAKRCAIKAETEVVRVDEKTKGVQAALVALTTVVGDSLARLHARLDEHFKNGKK